jgi:hypothetical protein
MISCEQKLMSRPGHVLRCRRAVAVLSLAMGAAVIMKGLSKPITYLNTFNVEQMQSVFRSNSTWVVLCKQSGSELKADQLGQSLACLTATVFCPLAAQFTTDFISTALCSQQLL